jgi:uncharacterized protein YqgC (DUF456 family)
MTDDVPAMETLLDLLQQAAHWAGWGGVGLLALLGLLLSCLGISGGYLIALAAALAAPLSGAEFPGWGVPLAFALVAGAVDVAEWMASHWGVRRRGGSRLAGFAAMGGGLAGLVVGSMLLPLVGSLLGMMAGSFGLAYWVERNRLQTSAPAAHIATGAVLACIAILMLKVAVALVLVAVLFAGIVMS